MNGNRFLKKLPFFWPIIPITQRRQPPFRSRAFELALIPGSMSPESPNVVISGSWKDDKDGDKQSYSFPYSHLLTAASITLAATIALEEKKVENFFFTKKSSTEPVRNQMKGRVATVQYSANNPIEDRYSCTQMKNIEGFAVTVFDGHGGTKVSEFAHNALHIELDKAFAEIPKTEQSNTDAWVSKCIELAFERVESFLLKMQLDDLKKNQNQKAGRVGSCCLLHLIANDKIYSANMGDCRSIVVKRNGVQPGFVKLNKKQNANSSREQAELRRRFPNDKNIVHCKKGNSSACYVKGRLQPTRAFGDFHLKNAEFLPENPKHPIVFNGPYIRSDPEIIIHELTNEDVCLVAGSDGLWDEMSFKDVVNVINEEGGHDPDHEAFHQKIAEKLLRNSLQHAADQNKLTVENLASVPLGVRRHLHDDLTILVVNLKNQL